ncbi:MAG: ABC transporter ATP-binding protein, partial [Clostridia bacterium]|nr:ABC transporter ATP-binding protein [Clostridia bacterium]
MIQLKGIKKVYKTEERKVNALKGITLDMRDAEFLCVLGPSGCGKTTLLNIIGGLDRYTSGDLVIGGKSTKNFTDVDWDTYRSRKVGFVFQNYNLISHQTVLENVETALVISGIGREERRKRAIQALVDVGLSEHLRKTPRQLSGGEMQRVAIARALVNNPKMILADEPTGALDNENSVKIMELLKVISKDRLVVMVTHNAELASEYATRTIKMKDGLVVSDDKPFDAKQIEKKAETTEKVTKQSHMPYSLAAKLSVKNLAGKKIRTALTSIASSIAIVGIALVLACHNGLNAFIDKVQKDTMSSVPITVSTSDTNLAPQIEGVLGYVSSTAKGENKPSFIESVIINHTLKNMKAQAVSNEITQHFIEYLKGLDSTRVRYDAVKNIMKRIYKNVRMPIYSDTSILKNVSILDANASKWSCLPPDRSILEDQYHLVAGKYPENFNELLLVVDKNSSISDTVLATYLLDVYAVNDQEGSRTHYTYEEILTKPEINEYHLLLNDDYYVERDGLFYEEKSISLAKFIHKYYRSETQLSTIEGDLNKNEIIKLINGQNIRINCFDVAPETDNFSTTLKIVGIIKLNEDTQYGMFTSPIAYLPSLNDYVIEEASKSKIVQAQQYNYQNGINKNALGGGDITSDKITVTNLLSSFGYAELPTKIKFYPNTIEDKDYLLEQLDYYNANNGENPDITYVDNVGA